MATLAVSEDDKSIERAPGTQEAWKMWKSLGNGLDILERTWITECCYCADGILESPNS